MSDTNIEEMMKIWREQPQTARLMFPAGLTYAIQKGDTLGNLGERFGIAWEKIADATMGTHKPAEINSWLEKNGGKKLKSGYWAFNDGQEVKIPAPEDGATS